MPTTHELFTTPLDGIHLIETSAGTGKTWTLCGLYVRLLLEPPRTVPEILVVTFTKAATLELRDLIRHRLVDLERALEGGAAGAADPFVVEYLGRLDGGDRRPRCARGIRAGIVKISEPGPFNLALTLRIRRNFFFPTYAGLSEARLAQGELAKARDYAQRLHDFSADAPERTYLALSHRLFAEIALRERALAEAETRLTPALGLVEAAEVPLATWRVYASAAKLYEQLLRPTEAEIYQRRSADVRLKLAASLDEIDPLRRSIVGLGEQ